MYFEFKHLKNTRFEVVEMLVSITFALSCLFLYWFFPLSVNDLVENLMKLFFFLVFFPIAFTKIILKKGLSDLYVGKPTFTLKSNLFLLLSLIIGSLGCLIIYKSSLFNYYTTKVLPVTFFKNPSGFKIFLAYEITMALLFFASVFFSFGFVNFITRNFPKLNVFLSILTFYFLVLFDSSKWELKETLIGFLLILPIVFFKKVVNEQKSIWIFFSLIFILNVIFNAVIIKLSI